MSINIFNHWFSAYREIDDVTVVQVDLSPHDQREATAYMWLDKEEQYRWKRYRFDRPRREFCLCRAALRAVLCSQLGCANTQLTFGISEYGKPYGLIDGVPAPIKFNVSHGGKYGLIAYAMHGRLGVDVEERNTRTDLDSLSEAVFCPEEQADFALTSGKERLRMFYSLWTLKEAMIKATGLGFSQDPSEFQIPSSMRYGARRDIFQFPKIPYVKWKLENLGNSQFAAAIVHEMIPTSETYFFQK